MNFNQINSLETLEEYCNSRNCPECCLEKECDEWHFPYDDKELMEYLLPIVIKKQRKEKLRKLLKDK